MLQGSVTSFQRFDRQWELTQYTRMTTP